MGHQSFSALATAVDGLTMTTLVHLAHLSPPAATAVAASLGGVVHFTCCRKYVFPRAHSAKAGAALRYALVALASALLNTIGVLLGSSFGKGSWATQRLFVAVLVSLAWNLPMHSRFVFRT